MLTREVEEEEEAGLEKRDLIENIGVERGGGGGEDMVVEEGEEEVEMAEEVELKESSVPSSRSFYRGEGRVKADITFDLRNVRKEEVAEPIR